MREKFGKGSFGVCPRVLCDRQPTLPIGMSEEIRTSRVKIYCPRCQEVYIPKKKCHDIDAAINHLNYELQFCPRSRSMSLLAYCYYMSQDFLNSARVY